MLKSLFNIVAGQGLQLYYKELRNRCFPVNFTKFLRRPNFVEHLQTTTFRNTVMWGFNLIYKTLRKIHIVSRFTQLLNYLFKIEHVGWYFHP